MSKPNDSHDHHNGSGTTHEDYRWKGLSTVWAILYGLGFPFYLVLTQLPGSDMTLLPGMILTPLFFAWGGTVVYVIGPENVDAWKALTQE